MSTHSAASAPFVVIVTERLQRTRPASAALIEQLDGR